MTAKALFDIGFWIPPQPGDKPAPGYDEWLVADIEAGIADLDAGRSVSLEEVKEEFGFE